MTNFYTGPPLPELSEPVIAARPSAILLAAGAFDTSPVEFSVSGFESMCIYLTYIEGAVGGSVGLQIEFSDLSSGDSWYKETLAEPNPTVTGGATTVNPIQALERVFNPVGVGTEKVVIGPLELDHTIERARISAHEIGVVGTPGTAEIKVLLSP